MPDGWEPFAIYEGMMYWKKRLVPAASPDEQEAADEEDGSVVLSGEEARWMRSNAIEIARNLRGGQTLGPMTCSVMQEYLGKIAERLAPSDDAPAIAPETAPDAAHTTAPEASE